ncbi:MFS transporter, partial [Mycobacterium tuberculosis]|nr:MFS transporter [Mycobacterium tuberculosis]
NVPVGIAGIWITWRFAPDTKAQRGRRLDPPAQLTGAFALAALTFASTEISALGWRSPVTVSAVALCAALGIAFVRLAARTP